MDRAACVRGSGCPAGLQGGHVSSWPWPWPCSITLVQQVAVKHWKFHKGAGTALRPSVGRSLPVGSTHPAPKEQTPVQSLLSLPRLTWPLHVT